MTAVNLSGQPQAGVDRRLREYAQQSPQQIAVREFHKGRCEERTFAELEALVDRTCHALLLRGIRRGMRTVLMVTPGREFLACTFALLRIGAPPTLVDPGLGISGLKSCLDRARPEAFVGIAKAHWARLILGWGRSTIHHRFGVGSGPFPPDTWKLDQLRKKIPDQIPYEGPVLGKDEIAAVLFTSGSTGPAKGAIAHHGQLEAQVDALAKCHRLQPGEVDLPTFPLFGLFGVAMGMTSTVPVMDFTRPAHANPQHLLDLIDRYKVTNLFASPALLGSLSRHLQKTGTQLRGLKRVISAGAPARHGAIETLSQHLSPETSIETPYGATEGLPLCHVHHDQILATHEATSAGNGVCIGSAVDGIDLQIVEPGGKPDEVGLPNGHTGEIWVSGPTVSRGYLFDEEADAIHKFTDQKNRIWHRTGDMGMKDTDNQIWFRGRTSQRVLTSQGPLDTVATERIFETHPGVFRTALVGVGPIDDQQPVLCVEPAPDSNLSHAQIQQDLLKQANENPLTRTIDRIVITGPFPVDIRHNAKIQREQLALMAGRMIS